MELCHQSLLNLPGSLPSCCCSMQQPPLLTALPEGTIMSHLTELITATLHPPPPSLAQTTSAGTPSCLPRLPLPSPPPTDLLLCGLHGERSCYVSTVHHACMQYHCAVSVTIAAVLQYILTQFNESSAEQIITIFRGVAINVALSQLLPWLTIMLFIIIILIIINTLLQLCKLSAHKISQLALSCLAKYTIPIKCNQSVAVVIRSVFFYQHKHTSWQNTSLYACGSDS